MRPFMDYLQASFYEATRWDPDNCYSSFNASARALLFFDTPRGLRVHVSSLSSPHSATSYDLGSIGLVDGSLSYLYSSLPIQTQSKSGSLELRDIIQGYRHVRELRRRQTGLVAAVPSKSPGGNRKDTLLYGRMYLPQSTLEALYLRRLSPTRQLQLSCVSDSTLKHGGTILALLQQDVGKYNTECLYSTDSALLGFRGLYNFGPDPREEANEHVPPEQLNGRLSAGGELYYGVLNKSGGVSGGLRFTTLPRHGGFPYTMTLTLNPLMGNLSSSYAVKAGRYLAMCSQFDFNFYSYESAFRVGFELWKTRQGPPQVEWARRLIRPGWKQIGVDTDEDVAGVLKARVDNKWRIGLLWEGRLQELLFSVGLSLDLQRREQIFRAVGAELQFSS